MWCSASSSSSEAGGGSGSMGPLVILLASPVSPHLRRRGLSPTKLLSTAAAAYHPSPTIHRHYDQRRTGLQQCRTAAADKVLYPAGMRT